MFQTFCSDILQGFKVFATECQLHVVVAMVSLHFFISFFIIYFSVMKKERKKERQMKVYGH